MPFPTGTPVVTLVGTIPSAVAGTGYSGRIILTPSAELIDSTRHAVYPGGGTVDFTSGSYSVSLIPNNAAGIEPAGWKWHVDLQPEGGKRVTFWASIEGANGDTIQFDSLVPIPAPGGGPTSGGGGSSTPTGPAGGALTGTYPNPSLSSATIASFDTAGAASAAQTAAATDATNKVATHTAAADPHADRAYTDTQIATRVPNSRQITAGTGLTGGGTLAADRTLSVAYGTTAGTAAVGNDSRLSDSRTPTGTASGDLSGTYPGPTVAKVNGVTISGTAPTSGQVLTASSGAAASWQTPAAGGGAAIRTATARITNDDLSGLPSAPSWVVVLTSAGTPLQCSIAASAGDRIRLDADFMHSGTQFLDWVLLDNTGAIAVYGTTRTGTPPAEGSPSMYPSLSFSYVPGGKQFVVASGHINAGMATIALAHQGAGAGKVYAHTTYPFELMLTNLGPEPA